MSRFSSGYLRYILPTWAIYMGLTQNYAQPTNWVLGFLVAVFVTYLLNPQPPDGLRWHLIPSELQAFVRYSGVLGWDLLRSGVQLARIVTSRNMPLAQGIIKLETYSHDPLDAALSAHSITLTPGEMVLEIADDGAMYTHCLDAPESMVSEVAAQQRRQRLLNLIYGRELAVPPTSTHQKGASGHD